MVRPAKLEDIEIQEAKSEADIESDYACEICGKGFNSEVSLKGHKLRSHRTPLSRKEESPLPEEGAPIIPTEKDTLKGFLTSIRFRNIDVVMKFCDELGYDVKSVYYTLKKSYASRDVIDAIISIFYWSLRRGEPIPSDIKRELKPSDYEASFRHPIYEDDELMETKRRLGAMGYKVTKEESGDLFDKFMKWEGLKAKINPPNPRILAIMIGFLA